MVGGVLHFPVRLNYDPLRCPPGRNVRQLGAFSIRGSGRACGAAIREQTGIKMEVPDNCMLQIMNKSGIASKKHLIAGACVVDEGYSGEIFVNLHNIGDQVQFVEPGQKIAQGVFVRIEKP